MLLNDTHITLARELAMQSQCVRRKYGVVITDGIDTVVTNNQRVTGCCNNGCIKDRLSIEHGQGDLGGEVHAEQAALIRWHKTVDRKTVVLIQGFYRDNTEPMLGEDLYPCYTCARMLKFAGFRYVWLSDKLGLTAVSVSEILEYWEERWENPLT